ncbi:MAG: helix-turn-helix domain-containing protein [Candidatus Omnitrophica bacterium]|nr:helix-turn-helix domain-containing protein [Candidatus Omnitrophota bacterium]
METQKPNIEQVGSLMTIDEVAGYLRVKKRTVYDWVKKGKIPAMKTVGLWRFRRDRIDQWLESDAAADATVDA